MTYLDNRPSREGRSRARRPDGGRRHPQARAGAEVHAPAHQAVRPHAAGHGRPDGLAEAADLEDQVRQPHPAPPGQEATALPPAQRRADLSRSSSTPSCSRPRCASPTRCWEDSIERGELRQTMMEMIADAISRDMEEVLVSGDTASADRSSPRWTACSKQATSHVVDAAGCADLEGPAARSR